MNKEYSIVICALNEEANIGHLLDDLALAGNTGGFTLENIYVISDGSTDATDEIILSKASANPRIKLHKNQQRLGKMKSLLEVFQRCSEDVLVLLDADVRIHKGAVEKVVEHFAFDGNLRLVGGNPVPSFGTENSVASRASVFSWRLLDRIKTLVPKSIYSAHGRILGLSRELYQTFSVSAERVVGTDQLMHIAAQGKFDYVPDSVVYYKVPQDIADYIKQNKRFRLAKKDRLIDSKLNLGTFVIPNRGWIFVKTAILYPIEAVCWMGLYFAGWLSFVLDPKMRKANAQDYAWTEVKSSK